MRPRRTPSSNKTYRLVGGNEDNDLWVQQGQDERGRSVILSTWELTPEERELVGKGYANIELCVWTNQTPPVSLALTIQPLGKDGNG